MGVGDRGVSLNGAGLCLLRISLRVPQKGGLSMFVVDRKSKERTGNSAGDLRQTPRLEERGCTPVNRFSGVWENTKRVFVSIDTPPEPKGQNLKTLKKA